MTESSEWILKIISGPHQGAEVTLRSGRVMVGASSECDVVLHDVLVAPQHFALTLDGGKLTVEPIEGPLFCNGKRIAASAPVPAFAFLTAGTTHLVLGPAGVRWPLLSVADVPELEKAPATSGQAKSESVQEEAPAATPGGKKTPKPPTPEQRRRAWWTAGIGGVLLLVWVILWFKWAPHSTVAPQISLRDRAEQVLRAFPEARGVKLLEQGDRLVAKGFVPSDSAQREVTAAFRDDAPEVTVRIWSTPRMVETMRSLLAARNLNVEIAASPDGEVRIRGVVSSAGDWAHARQTLLSEVPGLETFADEVIIAPAASAPARAAASVGIATPTQPANTESLSVVALQDLGNGQGWLRLSNGSVLFRGATLPQGGRIVAFNEGRAIVEHPGGRSLLTVGVDVNTALHTTVTPEPRPDAALPAGSPVAAKENTPQNG